MPIKILMPALSPTMEEGTLARWLVKEGDSVSSGEIMAEIETDKATMEFEAIDEGIVGKIVVPDGTEGVKVNDVIAILLEEGESEEDLDAEGAAPDTPKEPAPKSEAKPEQNASLEPDSPQPLASKANAQGEVGERIFASPLARRLAAEKSINLSDVEGSGPHGRIVKADIESAKAKPVDTSAQAPASEPKSEAPAPIKPGGQDADAIRKIYADRDFEEIKLDGMRKFIAARLTEAKQTIPHFYLRRDIRLDALLAFRSQLNKELEARGVKLSVNDFVIKACAIALQEVPDCNAVWAGDRILKLKASDVAVAVAVEGGLFTPVIRDADRQTLSAISAQMKDLASRARSRKLAPQEYQGGSFAISNLGMMGIENFDAVINPPHASILAVGAGVKKPIVDGNQIEVATVMSVTLSVDHRLIDGALGASFLGSLKTYLEHPIGMLA